MIGAVFTSSGSLSISSTRWKKVAQLKMSWADRQHCKRDCFELNTLDCEVWLPGVDGSAADVVDADGAFSVFVCIWPNSAFLSSSILPWLEFDRFWSVLHTFFRVDTTPQSFYLWLTLCNRTKTFESLCFYTATSYLLGVVVFVFVCVWMHFFNGKTLLFS